ncbi:MAG TPA: GNAT family N-acetyltransferase [Chitinophagales bacterium]
MNADLRFEILTEKYIAEIAVLGWQLNPKLSTEQLEQYLKEMFLFPTYRCFGVFQNNKLVGISSGWITVRFYSGKQLEVDNVVIDSEIQSKGIGAKFFEYIEDWAKKNDCKNVELNAYVSNAKAHKFYFRNGYWIMGFHFVKGL